ncbi:hypothetical protein SPV_2473 [Streptococcus pneumoniae]|nr:hypothetical protein SPV_2473 [Streptococcus pneumoniae]
MGIVLL